VLACPSFCASYTTFNAEIRGGINGFSTKGLALQVEVNTIDGDYVDKGSFSYSETLIQNTLSTGTITKSSNVVDQVVSVSLSY